MGRVVRRDEAAQAAEGDRGQAHRRDRRGGQGSSVPKAITNLTKLPPEAEPLTGEAFRKAVIEENKRWQEIAAREKISVQ
jgi:hypothetical protein